RRRVRQEAAVDHHVVERLGDLPHRGVAASVSRLTARDRQRNPPAHLLGRFDDLAPLPREIALPQNPQGRLGPLPPFRWASVRQHGQRLLLKLDNRSRYGPSVHYILW